MKKIKELRHFSTALPLFLLMFMFLLLPLGTMVVKSFTKPSGTGFALSNYINVFTKAIYLAAIRNSLYLSFVSTVIGLTISFIAALAVTQVGTKSQNSFMSILNMVSNFAGLPLAFAFIIILGTSGVLVQIAKYFGVNIFANYNLYTGNGLMLLFVYFQIPLGTLLLIPSFQGIQPEWKESASLMKANSFQFWIRIGIPALIPSIADTFGMLFANALTAYATVYVLMTTNYPVLPIKIASMFTGEMSQQQEMGSALSITMILIMLIVIGLCNLSKKLLYKGGTR